MHVDRALYGKQKSMARTHRVVITGLGVLAANGIGKEDFWASLIAGRSGIGPITLFDASQHPCRIAGEVKNFNPAKHIGLQVKTKRLARQTQLALAATREALEDAQLMGDLTGHRKGDVPLFLGISTSAMDLVEQGMEKLLTKGPKRVPTHIVQGGQPHQAASVISEIFPFLNLTSTISSACAAGLDAVAMAYSALRSGRYELAVAGGADAPINPLTYACLANGGLLTARNEHPEKASRPFDRSRDSGVVAEGAGIVVLETLEHALERGVKTYLEISGYASHMDTDPEVAGSGLALTIINTLAQAGKLSADVDFVCAHGPGHPVLDVVETLAIKETLGAHAYEIPVISIKGATGNPLAAAGCLQIIACALCVQSGIIPPTANCEEPDPECDLDYVPRQARRANVSCMLINSHGLGGGNSAMIVEKVK